MKMMIKIVSSKDHFSFQTNQCPARVLECQYCHLDCKAGELQQHEGYCGSRTEKCPDCSDFVMLKDWEAHQKMTLYHGESARRT